MHIFLCWKLRTVYHTEWQQNKQEAHFQTKKEGCCFVVTSKINTLTEESSSIVAKLFPPPHFLFEPETFIARFAVMTDGWSAAHQDVWGLHTNVGCSNRLLWINQESCFLLLCTIWLYKHLAFLSCLDSDIANRAAKVTCREGRDCDFFCPSHNKEASIWKQEAWIANYHLITSNLTCLHTVHLCVVSKRSVVSTETMFGECGR